MNLINLKSTFLINLAAAASCLLSHSALAECNQSNFDDWKDCFAAEKLEPLSDELSLDTFSNAQYIERVVKLDQKQPEKKLSFTEYKKLIGLDTKIKRARQYYEDNKDLLQSIGREYMIEPEIIVALVGMESDFGRIQGSFNIIDSLATLSFDGRRRAFFEKELINALKISYQDNIPYDAMKGSWAGAMGQTQFMPSSYLNFAVDHDNDGRRDIWKTQEDAFASAANYLRENGWSIGKSSIKLSKGKNCTEKSRRCALQNDKLLISLENNGIIAASYTVGTNFNVLMKWNRSTYFCTSALLIANSIGAKHEAKNS